MRLFAPYYYGRYKWDNYLLDIQETIATGNAAKREGNRLRGQAIEVARDQLAELRAHAQQLERIEGTLNSGFEALRAEFEWGFTQIADRLDSQIQLLSAVTAQLDAIHKTLQSPLMTQARELFELGQRHFQRGLLDRALDVYLKAEQKNEVDFPLQLQIGKLYLYGRSHDDDVIDLPNAERHLLLAGRYAEAEKGTVRRWNEYCAQAYFHAAIAAYLIGEQQRAAGLPDAMRACLERALAHLSRAARLWPRFTEILYAQAKCHALLGQVADALSKLDVLSDRDRRYFAKQAVDGDFAAFRAEAEAAFRRSLESPGPQAQATQAKMYQVEQAVAWARRSKPAAEDTARIDALEREGSASRKILRTFDVDIEGLSERLSQVKAELEAITQRSFGRHTEAAEQAIAATEQSKRTHEHAIEQLRKTMDATSGTGFGWLFCVLFFFGAYVAVVSLVPSAPTPVVQVILFIGTIACAIIGFFVGGALWSSLKNRPHRTRVEEHSAEVDRCVAALPALRQQAETWRQEMRDWAAGTPPAEN